MSGIAHTPGPWKYREVIANRLNMIEGEGPSWYVIHNVKDGHGLAQTFSTYERIGESEANARLIAAAPDLLYAVKSALFALSNPGAAGHFDLDSCAATGTNQTLRAQMVDAITKAEGR